MRDLEREFAEGHITLNEAMRLEEEQVRMWPTGAAMLCSFPGCQNVAEIILPGRIIPTGAPGRSALFCPTHEIEERQPETMTTDELSREIDLHDIEVDTHIPCPNQCAATLLLNPQTGDIWCYWCMEAFDLHMQSAGEAG